MDLKLGFATQLTGLLQLVVQIHPPCTWGFGERLPSGCVKIAIENGHRNSGFTHKKMVISNSYVSLPEGKFMVSFF